jgi:hypothetical protein
MGIPDRCGAATKALLLVFTVWCGASAVVFVSLITTGSGDPNVTGKIVLPELRGFD